MVRYDGKAAEGRVGIAEESNAELAGRIKEVDRGCASLTSEADADETGQVRST